MPTSTSRRTENTFALRKQACICAFWRLIVVAVLAQAILCSLHADDARRLWVAERGATERDTVDVALVEVRAGGQFAFRAAIDGKRMEVAGKELIRWGAFTSATRGATLIFDNGDAIAGSALAVDADECEMRSVSLGAASVSRKFVRAVVLRPPTDLLERDRLFDQLAAPRSKTAKDADANAPTADRVILDNGDVALGAIQSLGGVEVSMESGGKKISLPVDRVRALVFARSRKASDSAPATGSKLDGKAAASPSGDGQMRFVFGFADGSRLHIREAISDGDRIRLTLTSGDSLSTAITQVVAVQSLWGRATYLSDLSGTFKHVPYLAATWPLALDRNVAGGRLRCGSAEFLKGLGMHSAARATYTLDKPYRRFDAELAIDNHTADRGSVVFRVYTDENAEGGAWKLRYQSDTIRGGAPATAISVDVAGAKRLSLIVDYADRADEWDRANWLDARLIE